MPDAAGPGRRPGVDRGSVGAEAGVTPATASGHLRRLLEARMLRMDKVGRCRYYRLRGPEVGRLLEAMEPFAPRVPIRSLTQATRAGALRDARTCYDHVAGRLGVALMQALLDRGLLTGGDGQPAADDPTSGYGRRVEYQVTPAGQRFLDHFGVRVPAGRLPVRYCVDWTEQAHHLSGGVGAGLLDRLLALGWVNRSAADRSLRVTPRGRQGFAEQFGLRAADA